MDTRGTPFRLLAKSEALGLILLPGLLQLLSGLLQPLLPLLLQPSRVFSSLAAYAAGSAAIDHQAMLSGHYAHPL